MRIRFKWYATAAVAGLVAVVLVACKQVPRDQSVPKVDPPADRVRVEHELVQPDVIEPVRVVSAGVGSAKVTARGVTTPRRHLVTRAAASTTAPDTKTLGQRARRAFFGDGRHRPQPFPTVR